MNNVGSTCNSVRSWFLRTLRDNIFVCLFNDAHTVASTCLLKLQALFNVAEMVLADEQISTTI